MFADLPIWAFIIYTLVVTQISIAAVTIYLHRHQTHRALDLHPVISHFFRAWLWLTTGMITKEWVAIHRKHHAKVETEDDPHSPQIHGIKKVLFDGVALYRKESFIQETLDNYGFGTPQDWIEIHLYSRMLYLGIFLLLLINFLLFGFIGISIWAIQIAWVPFHAAGVINGVGHWWGYRNFESPDASTNIIPFGLFIGGEELHNNHHAFASSARFSSKWYEIDLGWYYISLLQTLKLAKVKKLAPVPVINRNKDSADLETVQMVLANRFHVMSDYAKHVMRDVYREEKLKAAITKRKMFRQCKRILNRHESLLDTVARNQLDELLSYSDALNVVYEYRQRLQQLWMEKTASQEKLLSGLQEWCRQAEETGIESLREFAIKLRSYDSVPA
jgi:stearoyl-CoA desaturase (delta-9 desaturase)